MASLGSPRHRIASTSSQTNERDCAAVRRQGRRHLPHVSTVSRQVLSHRVCRIMDGVVWTRLDARRHRRLPGAGTATLIDIPSSTPATALMPTTATTTAGRASASPSGWTRDGRRANRAGRLSLSWNPCSSADARRGADADMHRARRHRARVGGTPAARGRTRRPPADDAVRSVLPPVAPDPDVLAIVDATVSSSAILHLQNGSSCRPSRQDRVEGVSDELPSDSARAERLHRVHQCLLRDRRLPRQNGATWVVPKSQQRLQPPSREEIDASAVAVECRGIDDHFRFDAVARGGRQHFRSRSARHQPSVHAIVDQATGRLRRRSATPSWKAQAPRTQQLPRLVYASRDEPRRYYRPAEHWFVSQRAGLSGVGTEGDADYLHEALATAERRHFWFVSRAALLGWAMRRYFPRAQSILKSDAARAA